MSFNYPNGKKTYYAGIVYSDKNNGVQFSGNSLDNVTIAASHEWSEAVTDPDVNNGRLGWYDKHFGEIGDIPVFLSGAASTVYKRIKGFAVQKEWSNRLNKAVIKE